MGRSSLTADIIKWFISVHRQETMNASMGKPKNKRNKQKGCDASGQLTADSSAASLGGANDVDSARQTPTAAAKFIEKLESTNCEERVCACTTIANLASSHANVLQLLHANMVKVMAPLLLDDNAAVRRAALGAFRNVTVDGGPEVCETLVRQGVMAPLVTLLKQYAETSQSSGDAEQGRLITDNAEVLLEAVHLLWNLCENSQVAVDIFNRESLMSVLWPWLEMERFGLAFSTVVAQCIYTVTEDNKDAIQPMAAQEALQFLDKLLKRQPASAHEVLMQSLLAGIMYNLRAECEDHMPTVAELIPVLANILEQDTDALLCQVAALISAMSSRSSDVASPEDSEQDTSELKVQSKELDEKVDMVTAIVSGQQLAVEVITNICCPTEDGDGWEECGSSDGSTEDISADVDMDTEEPDSSVCLTPQLHSFIISNDIFTKVTDRSKPIEPALQETLRTHEKGRALLTSLTRVQTHCLVCLSNMVNVLDTTAIGGVQTLHHMWLSFSQLTSTSAVLQNAELLEAATSVLRATSEKLATLDSQKLCDMTDTDLQFLYKLGQECTQDTVRANAIRIVSIVGRVLAKQTTPHPLLKTIGLFLYSVVSTDQQLWVIAEALDAIFDVFAEDHTDPVLHEIDLVAKLQAVAPTLKTKMKQQRRSLGQHAAIVNTARSNLMRFINYKTTSCNGSTDMC